MRTVIRIGEACFALMCFVAATARADTIRWANTAGAGAWGDGGNWVGGNVPGTNDQAYFPNVAAGRVYPDLSGGNVAATNLYLDNGGAQDYDYIYATGGGSLTLKGDVGLTTVGGGKNYFSGQLNVGRPSNTSTQAWDNPGNNDIRFLASIGGTGTIWMASTYGMTYSNSASASYRGNLVMGNSRNASRAGSLLKLMWPHGTAGDGLFSFGRSADGSQGGTITLGSTVSPYTGIGGVYQSGGYWPRLQFCPITGANVSWTANFENAIEVTGFGGQFSWAGSKVPPLTATQGTCSVIRVTGRLYLGAPLYLSSDGIDQRPGYNTWTRSDQPLDFTGGVALYQQAPAEPLVSYNNRSGVAVNFRTPIVDGEGSYVNPLILQPAMGLTYVHGTNTFAGGTVIGQSKSVGGGGMNDSIVWVTTGRMGTGPMTVLPGGFVRVDTTNAVAPGQMIEMQSSPLALGTMFASDDRIAAKIAPASSGVFAFVGTSSATLTNLLASGGPGLGNGKVFLASGYGVGAATYNGLSLKAGPDNVYRLCGGMRGDQGGDQLILDNAANVSVLTDARAVQVGSQQIDGGGPVWFRDPNDFTGKLTIVSPWLNPLNSQLRAEAQNTTATPGISPIGSASGEMELIGGNYQTYLNASVTSLVVKAKVTVWSQSMLDINAGARLTSFQTTDLVLTNRAGLIIYFRTPAQVQRNERIVVLNAPAMSNGMVDPHIVAFSNAYHFAAYDMAADANGEKGFRAAASGYTAGLPDPGAGTEIADVAADPAVADARNVYAMRWGDFNVTGAGTLTNRSGGMLWNGAAARTFDPNLDCGGKEAVFFFSANQTLTVNGKLTSSAGLTKNGSGTLVVTNLSNALAGQLTVNQGIVDFVLDKPSPMANGSLGNVTNIYLNGGTLRIRNNAASPTAFNTLFASRTITIGPEGGGLARYGNENNMAVYFPGRITGPGCLYLAVSGNNTWPVLQNATNDWSGGTQIGTGENVGTRVVQGATIGKGPILVLRGARLRLEGDNLTWPGPPAVYLPLQITTYGEVSMKTNAPAMGALTGTGAVILGDASVNPARNTTLTLGKDNGSFTWYGCITESFNSAPARQALGTVVKDGAGTWTLQGRQEYRGATIVTNGTLNLIGSVRGDVLVGPAGTLSGVGLVGGTLALNGGRLALELSDVSRPLHVSGAMTILPGSSLNVVYGTGFRPGGGDYVLVQTGAPVTGAELLAVSGGLHVRGVGSALVVSRAKASVIMVR